MDEKYLDLMKKSAILGVLEDYQLMELVVQVQVKHYGADEVIIREGDPGDGMYIVGQGAVSIITEGKDGKLRATLGMLGPGGVFGEMAVLDEFPRSATAVALTDTACIFVPKAAFSDALTRYPAVALLLLPILIARLRESNRWVQSLL